MSPLIFLGVAVVLSVLGSIVIALRHRSPKTMYSSIDGFSERMRALAPDDESDN